MYSTFNGLNPMALPVQSPTMKDVARAAKCHPSTVSLALRGDVRIPRETQERVRSAAARLGYTIHPMISAWVSARRAGRPVTQRVAAAYLTCLPGSYPWKADQHFRSIYEGAKERAERYGFSLNEISVSEYGNETARLNRVLVTRNVQALIVGPTLEHHDLIGIAWQRFSLVTVGYGLRSPVLHRVTEDHHLGMKLAFEWCIAQGYRKIGLALVRQHNSMRRERWIGAYLYEQQMHLRPRERLPIFISQTSSPIVEANTWLKSQRPDVILADEPAAWRSTSLKTIGFALAAAYQFPGVHENNREIGRHASDLLISLVLRNERGIPAVRQTVLVEPSFEGGRLEKT